MTIALNCYSPGIPTGLGTLARAMWTRMPFDVALVGRHKNFGLTLPKDRVAVEAHPQQLKARNIKTVVAVERTFPDDLFQAARAYGVKTVMVVMHEWCNADCKWLSYTDVFVSPNSICTRKLIGLGIDAAKIVRCLPPIDDLPFTERDCVRRLVYSGGLGGVSGRKGRQEMDLAMRLMSPTLYLKIGTHFGIDLPFGPTVYAGYDAAIVPSHFEGLGLSMLEPMALGLPVLATDAEPMNEYLQMAYGDLFDYTTVQVKQVEYTNVWGHSVKSSLCDPEGIIVTVKSLMAAPQSVIRSLSRMGRAFIERECDPNKLWKVICD